MGIDDILVGFSRAFGTERSITLTEISPAITRDGGGGRSAITLTETAPTVARNGGGGKSTITLTEANPSVGASVS